MALSGREVMLVLRARDEATRVISRVSGAMSRLDRNAVATASSAIKQQQQAIANLRRNAHDVEYAYRQQTLAAREAWMQARQNAEAMKSTWRNTKDAEKGMKSYRQQIQLASRAYQQSMFDAQKARVSQLEQLRQEKQMREDIIERQRQSIAAINEEREVMRQRGHILMANGAGVVALGAATTYWAGVAGAAYLSNIKAAMDYNTQVRATKTQVDGFKVSLQQIDKLGKSVADSLPVAFEEIQPALYDIFSSIDVGFKGARTLIKQFSADSVGGMTDLATATRANIAIMNAYKISTKDASEVSDFMFRLVQKGVGTYDEFAKTIGQAIPSAVRLNVSLDELGGTLSFLTRNGLNTARSATTAARDFDALSNPKTATNLKKLGVNIKDAHGELLPFPQIIDNMSKKINTLKTTADKSKFLKDAFYGSGGTIQAMRFFNLVFGHMDEFHKRIAEMKNDTGSAAKAFKKMADSPQAKLQQLKNDWMLLRIEIGEKLLPVAMDVIEWVNDLIDKWQELSPQTRKTIVWIGAATIAITALIGVLTVAAGAFMILYGSMRVMNGGFGMMAGKGTKFLGTFSAIAYAAVLIYQNWDKLEPLFGGIADTISDLLGWFLKLPAPVKEVIGQVALAALIWPRLSAAVTATTSAIGFQIARMKQLSAEMTYAETRTQRLSGLMGALGGAARAAAGVAGLVFLQRAMADTEQSAKGFGTALDGVIAGIATGFAFGGPIGAGVGLIAGLASKFDDLQMGFAKLLGVEEEFNTDNFVGEIVATNAPIANMQSKLESLIATYDQLTGAMTAQTRTQALADFRDQYGDVADALGELGVKDRKIALALTGNSGALQSILRLADRSEFALNGLGTSSHEVADAFDDVGRHVKQARKQVLENIRTSQDLSALYKKFPKELATKIDIRGVAPTIKDIARVTKKYDLTPKQVQTLMEVLNVEGSIKDIQRAMKTLDDYGKKNPKSRVDADTKGADEKIGRTGKAVDDLGRKKAFPQAMLNGVPEVLANISRINSSLIGLDGNHADVYVYTHHVDLGGGGSGSGGSQGNTAPRRTPKGIVPRAVMGAAKKETKKISEALKRIRRQVFRDVIKDIADMMPQMGQILNVAAEEIDKKLNKLKKMSEKAKRKLKHSLLEDVREATEKDLKHLEKVTKRYRDVLAKLEKARNKLRNLRQAKNSFEESVRSDLRSFASFSGLEKPQDVFGNEEDWTVSNISSQLQSKLSQIKEFGSNLKKLLEMGFSKQVYRQVIEMGIVDGAAFAAALIQATPDEVSNINSLVGDITSSSNSIASAASSQLYDAGIKAAEGLVKGLKDKAEDLRKIAEHLGHLIAKAIKEALKIKSPSRVGKDIGMNFGGSIASGMKSQLKSVSRASTALASAMSFDPDSTYTSRPFTPVVGANGRGPVGPGNTGTTIHQQIDITTQEIDPRRHAAELGWELAARYGV